MFAQSIEEVIKVGARAVQADLNARQTIMVGGTLPKQAEREVTWI